MACFVGCGTVPKTEVVTKKIYVHPEVPDHLLIKVIPSERPVSVEDYLKMDIWDRETYMREFAQKVMKALNASNLNVSSIKKILEDTKKAADNESQSRN